MNTHSSASKFRRTSFKVPDPKLSKPLSCALRRGGRVHIGGGQEQGFRATRLGSESLRRFKGCGMGSQSLQWVGKLSGPGFHIYGAWIDV